MASRDGDRAVALSRQLARAHEELRRRIREIRTGLGHRRWDDEALLTHCLAFCDALTSHHQGEDDAMFSQLLRERPDLAPTIANLVEDHGLITSILSRVRELADRAAEPRGSTLAAIDRELDGLAAIMESHFRYEERTISAALDDGTPDSDWPDMVFGFGTT
ncbi:MAG: hemerythrin domain-containing protein [Streptomyces sp.]|uniref:hemerythrin domain-containing protein n=1 Tax=Streptomyces sp. TaxID=1931 RepID=UPI0025F9053B|nr:hemerythrin domain-containing protein [Streptomyces sp.]MBW8800159.1 hemerythrin domain-containing protein [Streptomyces sp.]